MKKIHFYLILIACAVYFGSLWQRPLFLPDEVRYAEIPREMIDSGDWVVPRCAGVEYTEKPVLGYWMSAVSIKLFGKNPFGARFPSALCTLLSALLIYLIARKLPDPDVPLSSVLIFLSSGLVAGVGTYAVLDAQFSFFTLLTVAGFYFAAVENSLKTKLLWLILAGAGLGCGFLIKGALILVLAGSAVFFWMLWEKRFKQMFLLPWLPFLIGALIVLPWALAIHRANPEFWYRFLYIEHIQRGLKGAGAFDDRRQGWYYYIPVLLGGFLPWVLFTPAILRSGFKSWKARFQLPELRLAAVMAGVWFVLFSCSSGKLGTYILPLFPALALLAGSAMTDGPGGVDPVWLRRTLKFFTGFFAAAAILLGAYAFLAGKLPVSWRIFRLDKYALFAMMVPAVSAWWCYAALKDGRTVREKMLRFSAGIAFLIFAVPAVFPERIADLHSPRGFFRFAVRPHLRPDTLIFAERPMATAAAWYLKRTDIGCYNRAGELEYGVKKAKMKIYKADDLKALAQKGVPVCVLSCSKNAVGALPFPKVTMRSGRFFAIFYNTDLPFQQVKK